MDLFSDFSFSKASSRRPNYDDVGPVEDISTRSSRSPSPFSSSSSISSSQRGFSESSNTLDYSEHIGQTLPSPPTPISSRLLGADRRKQSTAKEYFETIRSRRQCAIRQQCDPRRASAIRAYVESLISETEGYPNEMHPSSSPMIFPASNTSAPSLDMMDTVQRNLENTMYEDDELEALRDLSIAEVPTKYRSGSISTSSKKSHSVQKSSRAKPKTKIRF
jgi:hypothetical protein